MAKAPTKKTAGTKVTRITASDAGKAAAPGVQSGKPARGQKTATQAAAAKKPTKNPFARLMRYFKGAWHELRQVRWPDRKNTWAMTGALLAFTVFFIIVILVLDFAFSELFKLILGSN
ncbi:MAG: preprotein translocase subunit SecE [Acidobacteriota bacterium]